MLEWIASIGLKAKLYAALGAILLAAGIFIRALMVSNAISSKEIRDMKAQNDEADEIRRRVHTPDPDGVLGMAQRGYRD